MKYFTTAIAIAMILAVSVLTVHDVRGEVATYGEMEQVCRNWLSILLHENGSWAGEKNPQIIGVEDIVDDNGIVLARCYSISPRGFVIVPVLKELPPIKAYSDENNFDVHQSGGLPQLMREVLAQRTNMFIEKFGSMEAVQPLGDEALFTREHRDEWDFYVATKEDIQLRLASGDIQAPQGVGPLLTTIWHQGSPYNNACPMGDGGKTLVGCVATAAAQIMKYHNWPPQGNGGMTHNWNGDQSCGGSTPSQQLTVTFSDPYDWANMPNYCGTGCTPTQEAALAELNYEVAVGFRMDFGVCGSGAWMGWAPTVFVNYFSYDSSIDAEYRDEHNASTWFNVIQTEINEGTPMLYGIYSHAIVCDGWRVSGSLNQYHMNYGWGGSQNTWYTIDNLHCPWPGCNYLLESLYRNIFPSVKVAPSNIDFDTVPVGCAMDTSFTITNTKATTVNGNVSESCDHYSIVSGGGPFSLPPGQTLTVTVRFEPTASGTHQCTVETGSSDCSDVYLTGVGGDRCSVEPFILNFGGVALGEHLDLDSYLINIGCDTVTGNVSEICNHYSVVSGSGSFSLAPGETLTVTVRFEPTSLGSWNCTIDMGGSACRNINCSGICYEPPPTCSIEPDTLDFGNVLAGEYTTLEFDITNTGYGSLEGSISEPCDKYLTMPTGAFSLAHDETLTVTVYFFAGTVVGTYPCTIETGTDDCVDVFCTGNCVDETPPACLVESDSLIFGTVTVGDSLDMGFFITNTGGDTLFGDVSETCDHYSIVSGGGPYALAAAETAFVTTRFKPTMNGYFTCTIETGSASCVDVFCSGSSDDPPACYIEPDSLDFGTVNLGDSLDAGFFITNVGGGILSGTVSDTCSYFDVVTGGGPFDLAVGETLQVAVRYKPLAEGLHECFIETGTTTGDVVHCSGMGEDLSGGWMARFNTLYLHQNYPNPFNPTTTISFVLPEKMNVTLTVYDLSGSLVKTLVNNTLERGLKKQVWDGTDARGNPVSSGIYFYRLKAGNKVLTRKMVLLK